LKAASKNKEANMDMEIFFFGVIVDGFGRILCSQCEQDMISDSSIDIVFIGPVHGPAISCARCGVRPTDTEETALETIARKVSQGQEIVIEDLGDRAWFVRDGKFVEVWYSDVPDIYTEILLSPEEILKKFTFEELTSALRRHIR
jgi:hypothetical protein